MRHQTWGASLTLATARYHLAALADHADSIDASSAYDPAYSEIPEPPFLDRPLNFIRG